MSEDDALNNDVAIRVDARGLTCPMPLLKAKLALNKVAVGELISVTSTDVNSQRDIVAFTDLTSHELVAQTSSHGIFTYTLRKGQTTP